MTDENLYFQIKAGGPPRSPLGANPNFICKDGKPASKASPPPYAVAAVNTNNAYSNPKPLAKETKSKLIGASKPVVNKTKEHNGKNSSKKDENNCALAICSPDEVVCDASSPVYGESFSEDLSDRHSRRPSRSPATPRKEEEVSPFAMADFMLQASNRSAKLSRKQTKTSLSNSSRESELALEYEDAKKYSMARLQQAQQQTISFCNYPVLINCLNCGQIGATVVEEEHRSFLCCFKSTIYNHKCSACYETVGVYNPNYTPRKQN